MKAFLRLIFTAFLLIQECLAVNYAKVLIYSYTAGYRHDSIPTAITSLTQRGPSQGINFTNSEQPSDFNDDYLSQFDALFFLQNTDEVLDNSGKSAFQRYLDQGGNFIGAHAASDCLLNFTTMELTLGSQFDYHPDFTNATMIVIGPAHPSTANLPQRWHVQDEIYNFVQNPRDIGAVVVLTVDNTSYIDTGDHNPAQGSPHPIAWYQEHLRGTNSTGLVGRSWYTGLGHASAAWEDDTFMSHIMGGITWVLASNTTRWVNPSANVGSTGPVYVPPIVPTATATATSTRSGAASLLRGYDMRYIVVLLLCTLAASWTF